MNIVKLMTVALSALKAGQALSNPTAWKKVQILAPYLGSLATTANGLICDGCIAQPDLDTIVLGVSTLAASVVNHYLTVATTDKLGIK
jgi:hypothetical protein